MQQATFRFYAELNDFLSPERRKMAFSHPVAPRASVKDVIEALGVPHTEVELILVNGVPVGFGYTVLPADRISVYPAFRSLEPCCPLLLRPRLQDFRFVLDTHLGRLARYLRMLGFDALYESACDDHRLSGISARSRRVLLTRDRGLLKRGEVTYGYFVRATEPRTQLVEVFRRFNLFHAVAPFRRCMCCNFLLEPVSKESVCDRLPRRTGQRYNDFFICRSCDRVYWAGSHHEHMQRFIERMLRSAPPKFQDPP